ncbi:MAG TPA: hypothetical protein VG992_03525 [Candidatus Saccharimonadales bacterium]|nr:hypothetical protein [Candidatus Saccharimonadales bacterium]
MTTAHKSPGTIQYDMHRLLGLGVAVLVIVATVVISHHQGKAPSSSISDAPSGALHDAKLKENKDAATVLKSVLALYYTIYGRYPVTLSELVEDVQENPDHVYGKDSHITTLKQSISDLKDLDYRNRGDEQAYKFTYHDIDGKLQTISAEYEKDYN